MSLNWTATENTHRPKSNMMLWRKKYHGAFCAATRVFNIVLPKAEFAPYFSLSFSLLVLVELLRWSSGWKRYYWAWIPGFPGSGEMTLRFLLENFQKQLGVCETVKDQRYVKPRQKPKGGLNSNTRHKIRSCLFTAIYHFFGRQYSVHKNHFNTKILKNYSQTAGHSTPIHMAALYNRIVKHKQKRRSCPVRTVRSGLLYRVNCL